MIRAMTYAAISISINKFLLTHETTKLSTIEIFNSWVKNRQINSLTGEQSIWCLSLIERLKDCSREELTAAVTTDVEVPHPAYGFK